MATKLARAKMILAGALNKETADITNAMIERAGRGLAYTAGGDIDVQTYDASEPAAKLDLFVRRVRETLQNAVEAMDAERDAAIAALAARQAVAGEFAEASGQ